MINLGKEKLKLIYKEFWALKIAYTQRENIVTTKSKQAFIMLAANYDNLGDIAITKAQEEFLKTNLSNDYEIIIVPHDKTFNVFLSMKKIVNNETIITLIGGGNSGTLYEFFEWRRRFILKHFRKNKIISFPQSVFYSNEKCKKIYKKEFIKICKRCKDLTLIAREKQSYSQYKKMLDNKVNILLVPDIVFSLKREENQNRKGVSLIFRNDKEKFIDTALEKRIETQCKDLYNHVSYNDTCDVHISGNGYTELKNFIHTIKGKQLVVTDRLHGMILSYVAGTPCIALDNNNHKVKSTYETWLKKDGKTKLIEPGDSISNVDFNNCTISLIEKFEPLANALLNKI